MKQEEDKGDEARKRRKSRSSSSRRRTEAATVTAAATLPLEPTKTWLEFSPIQASAFDASMRREHRIHRINEDIEQSSIVVQNEQVQMEEAHLNRAANEESKE